MSEKRLLIVDDNAQYRAAVKRNLTLAGYQVQEADNMDRGLESIGAHDPNVVITDLDMRTHDEGLQFIREVKRMHPSLPMIMISAVGTFDEGALAREYGAMLVLSKSRIDAEIDTLYKGLDKIFDQLNRIHQMHERVDECLHNGGDSEGLREEIQIILQDQELDAGLKSRAYEMIDQLESPQRAPAEGYTDADYETAIELLKQELPDIEKFESETRTMLALAEHLQQSPSASSVSVSRNIGFSYSFAVENEVKQRIGRKVNRLLTTSNIEKLADQLYDSTLRNLDIFFNQYLIRSVQQQNLEINSDISRQVLERIIKHRDKYKPDGLKALGVILFCWGRHHEFSNRKGKVIIKNPLNMKGLDDDSVTKLSSELIMLQHLRNPFIHPEFSEREKTESVRAAALRCLALIGGTA
ncbi:MAG: response regulator [Candidatus Hinthialibacter antarcticus]|nr:response regulator [Candidatus Hinthialibacter antarcticus]